MKFRYLFSILPLCVAFFCAGCNLSSEEIAQKSISEIHNHYFIGSTQNFKISIWSGFREEPYEQNGTKGNMVDFCVVSVLPLNNISTYGLGYTIEVNSKTYNGEFEQSPFDKTLATDLQITLNDDDSIFAYITFDGITEISKMECISCDFKIDNKKAMSIAIETMKDSIISLSNNGESSIEGCCKIISSDKNLGIYFWYVRFINTEGQEIVAVIDTESGEIIAKKL